jgi:hypothetical protein
MGKRFGAALLLAIPLLPATTGRALAGDGEEPPATPVLPSPEDAAAVEGCDEVRAAFARGEFSRALDLATPVLRGGSHHESVAWVLYMACVAEGGLDHHLSCVEKADRYLLEMQERGHAERGYTPPVVLARATSLAALGRTGESEKALAGYLESWPGLTAARDARALLAAVRCRGPVSVEDGYQGRFRGRANGVAFLDSWWDAGRKVVVEALPEAVARVRSRLGEPAFEIPDVVVYFRDSAEASGEPPAATSLHVVASRKVAAIRVSAQALVTRRPEYREMLAAEVFRACVFASDAEGGPAWLLRALAAWASAPERVDPAPAVRAAGAVAEEAMAGLARALEGFDAVARADRRVQDAVGLLLVEDLERCCPPGTVRRLARKLLDGADVLAAFEEAVGRTPRAVLQGLEARARVILDTKDAATESAASQAR